MNPLALTRVATLTACLALSPGTSAWAAAATATQSTSGVAWIDAATLSDVQRAQAQAAAQKKPVFLYWGAVWCPPCNQVKATLFNRADFAALSKSFVMLRVDGDKPSAQQVAQAFKVRGYPSMLVLGADGVEITRLPGEVDPERYLATMGVALNSAVPVNTLVKHGRSGIALSDAQWQQLAWYAWDVDEQQAAGTETAAALDALAAAAPAGPNRDRLQLRAWILAAQDTKRSAEAVFQSQLRSGVASLLATPTRANPLADVWMGYADTLLKAATPQAGADREALAAALDKQLAAMLAGNRHSRPEVLDIWAARLSVAELQTKPAALQPLAIAAAQSVAAASTDKYERQAVVPTAAHVLAKAGDVAAADALLTAELPKAVAPYYHMLVLASNAKKRKDTPTALRWSQQAWAQSQGVATRAQWGAGHVGNLLELSPTDSKAVEQAASKVLKEALKPDALYARTARSMQRMAGRVQIWAQADASHLPTAKRLQTLAQAQCKSFPAKTEAKTACDALKFVPS